MVIVDKGIGSCFVFGFFKDSVIAVWLAIRLNMEKISMIGCRPEMVFSKIGIIHIHLWKLIFPCICIKQIEEKLQSQV